MVFDPFFLPSLRGSIRGLPQVARPWKQSLKTVGLDTLLLKDRIRWIRLLNITVGVLYLCVGMDRVSQNSSSFLHHMYLYDPVSRPPPPRLETRVGVRSSRREKRDLDFPQTRSRVHWKGDVLCDRSVLFVRVDPEITKELFIEGEKFHKTLEFGVHGTAVSRVRD